MRIVVASPDRSSLVVDVRRRLPGRGAWLHPRPDCLELALRRRAFVRALRLQGPFDTSDVAARIETVAAPGSPSTSTGSGKHRDEHPMSTHP